VKSVVKVRGLNPWFKKIVDHPRSLYYGRACELEFEHPAAGAAGSAARQSGGRVLSWIENVTTPLPKSAVGFLFWDRNHAAATKTNL
jgi:hypothetical protein